MASSGVGALEDVRVNDFTQVLADHICTRSPELVSEKERGVAGRTQYGLIGRPDLISDTRAPIALACVANLNLVLGELENFTFMHTEQERALLPRRPDPIPSLQQRPRDHGQSHFIVLKMTETPCRIHGRAPMVGEYYEDILRELGLPAAHCAIATGTGGRLTDRSNTTKRNADVDDQSTTRSPRATLHPRIVRKDDAEGRRQRR